MADREKVRKGLWMCKGRPENCGLKDCPYFDKREFCENEMHMDALSLMKEQELFVRCGDCENFCFDSISPNAGRCMLSYERHSKTWFCAHGKREEGR